MAVQIYINFNGNCKEAVEFYSEVFETEKPQILTFGAAPGSEEFKIPEGAENRVMHTELKISDSTIMFSDILPGMPFNQGNNISLTVVTNSEENVRKYFDGLKKGGSVYMELQETFWSKCYGSVTDKFGILWQLSCVK